MASQSIDRMVGKDVALARATVTHNEKKITAFSHIQYKTRQLNAGVRILEKDLGFPTIKVVHDISSWNVGMSICHFFFLTLLHVVWRKNFKNVMGEKEKCWLSAFSVFLAMFPFKYI